MTKEFKMPSKITLFFKRFFDILLSGLAILFLLPFFILFTPTVALVMRGNPFFVQKRIGKDCKTINLIKFRSMSNAKDKEGNLLPDKDRLNKFGKIMRATSIDELPELLNIFKGDMSIVGPRPLNAVYLPFYSERQIMRHKLRPGLTGLAQINGRNNLPWNIRIEYDLEYISKCSLLYDFKILLKTVAKVLKRDDVVVVGDNEVGDFYDDYIMPEEMISKEIGSFYCLGDEKIDGKGLNILTDKSNYAYVNSGRNTLGIVLDKVEVEKAYLPTFVCESVIEQFIKRNIQIEFYGIDKNLKIDKVLIEKVKAEKNNVLILLQSYFGNYELDDIKNKLAKLKQAIVVEDITHSLFKNGKFNKADYYIASLRKWGGFGEGGIIFSDSEIQSLQQNSGKIMEVLNDAANLQNQYKENKNSEIKEQYRALLAEGEELFDITPLEAMSDDAKNIIEKADFEDICAKRKENFAMLHNLFSEFGAVNAIFTPDEISGAPLYFPVYVSDNREVLQKFFIQRGIYPPVIWPKSTYLEGKTDDAADYIYEHILCFPIDQRYGKEDMIKIFKVLEDYCKQ